MRVPSRSTSAGLLSLSSPREGATFEPTRFSLMVRDSSPADAVRRHQSSTPQLLRQKPFPIKIGYRGHSASLGQLSGAPHFIVYGFVLHHVFLVLILCRLFSFYLLCRYVYAKVGCELYTRTFELNKTPFIKL